MLIVDDLLFLPVKGFFGLLKKIAEVIEEEYTDEGKAKSELKALTGFNALSVVSVKKDGQEWKVAVELLEKAGIPDRMDILGLYEARIDVAGNLIGYERKGLRKRGDTAGQELEETAE